MKINKEQIDTFIKAIKLSVVSGSLDVLRKGQLLCCVLNNTFPELAKTVWQKPYDSFYLDERIPAFIEAICDEEALQEWYSNEFVIKNFTNEKRNS